MGQYCFARWRLSSVVVYNAKAGGPAGRPPGEWAVRRPTHHCGPVRLRPVRAAPCFTCGVRNREQPTAKLNAIRKEIEPTQLVVIV